MKYLRLLAPFVCMGLWLALPTGVRAETYSCPPATPEGDQELSAEVVRYLLSGFGDGISTQGLPCLNAQRFPQFRIPKQGTEAGDIDQPRVQRISARDRARLVKVEKTGKDQIRAEFEVVLANGQKLATETVEFLRHHHPKAQLQLGCVSFLSRPQIRYRPVPGFCPSLPERALSTPGRK